MNSPNHRHDANSYGVSCAVRKLISSGLLAATATLGLSLGLTPSFAQAPLSLSQQRSDQYLTSNSVLIAQNSAQVIHVNALRGSDSQGNGSQGSPLQSITAALRYARPGTVIQLAPATYSAETGEVFPLEIPAQVVLQGDQASYGKDYIINGGGSYISPAMARQNVAILPEDGAEIRGVTVLNQGRRGYAVWLESTSPLITQNTFSGSVHDGVFIVGTSTATINNNRFYRNGANGLTVLGTASPTISNNLIQETGYGITAGDRSSPLISNNRISRNRSGLVITGNATPTLRQNLISENLEAGLVAIGSSQPILGSPTAPGENLFEGNGELDIHNATRTQILAAHGNQVSGQDRLRGQVAMNNPSATFESTRNTVPPLYSESATSASNPPQSAATASEPPASAPQIAAATAPTPTTETSNGAVSSPQTTGGEFRAVPFSPVEATAVTPTPSSSTSTSTASSSTPATGSPEPIPLTDTVVAAATTPRQYRVIITPRSQDTIDQVRQVAPNATEAQLAGRPVFVVGQYDSRAETQQVLNSLTNEGYFAIAEEVR